MKPRKSERHGTAACFNAGCHCDRCRKARSFYDRWRRVPGNVDLVDVTPVREHVAVLRSSGMGYRSIEAAAGVSRSTMNAIIGRPGRAAKRIRSATASRILAVHPQKAPSTSIDGTGTRRRLQALVAIGWSQRSLADRLEMTGPNLGRVIHGYCDQVLVRTARQVAELYDDLSMTPGPDPRSVARAAAAGWPPPLCWDDDTIDDPTASPAERRTDRRRSRAEVVEDFLDSFDHHLGEIRVAADRLGVNPGSLERTLYLARADGVDVCFHGSHRAIAS